MATLSAETQICTAALTMTPGQSMNLTGPATGMAMMGMVPKIMSMF
jgi:hypothetical protein